MLIKGKFMRNPNLIERNYIPSDPAFSSQWYLGLGPGSINVQNVWDEYTGQGVLVGVIDDGFDYTHPDLVNNYNTTIDYDYLDYDEDARNDSDLNRHGTSVAGIIASANNLEGGVGVAFNAEITGYRINFNSLLGTGVVDALNNAVNVDIVNNSYNFINPFDDDFSSPTYAPFESALSNLTSNGRNGLGTIVVFSGGNDRAVNDGPNYHNLSNSRYTIAVATTDQQGIFAPFSSAGSSLLIAAPGVDILTTDLTGDDGYIAGDYVQISGSSAAAPIISGVTALMLEANPNLGYRDVQEILAYSARMNDPTSIGWQYNGANNWNGGGLHFNHDYGFGLVDAHAAVRMAESWTLQQTSTNSQSVLKDDFVFSVVPDLGSVSSKFTIYSNIIIEHVIADISVSHTFGGDLVIKLISPSGTESVLLDRVYNGFFSGSIDFEFSSTAHWGENTVGEWTLVIEDQALGDTGLLLNWDLQFFGKSISNDNIYVFTNDFSNFSGLALTQRSTIEDTDGGVDTLNLAAVTLGSTIDLNGVQVSTIAGNVVQIAAGTIIENVIGGDGDDIFYGNGTHNILQGYRGNDVFLGSIGNDEIDGGQGNDALEYSYNLSEFVGTIVNTTTITLNHTALAFTDTLKNLETVIFNTISYAWNDLVAVIYGPQIITGTTDSETIVGTNNADEIHALAGDDYIYAKAGDDLVYAGEGNDTVKGDLGNDEIYGGDGNDLLRGEEGDDILWGGAGKDDLRGEEGNDELHGGSERDLVRGYAGDDDLFGDDGDDSLYGFAGEDELHGGQGDDKLFGMEDDDEIYGGDGNDKIYGGYVSGDAYASNDFLYGDNGNDIIYARKGDDFAYGGDGNDTILGEEGSDTIYGDNGIDNLKGGDGDDVIYGGNDDDVIKGQQDNDMLFGDDGEDQILGESGDDELYGGNQDDRLYGGNGFDTLYGDNGDDLLLGQGNHDTLYGGAGNDNLYGDENGASYAGNDTLYGQSGNDLLVGGNGEDNLIGGTGLDNLYGQGGSDKFIFGIDAFDGTIDQVKDFSQLENDSILVLNNILIGYDAPTSNIENFVSLTTLGSNTVISIDRDGLVAEYGFQQVASVSNTTNLSYENDIRIEDGVIL